MIVDRNRPRTQTFWKRQINPSTPSQLKFDIVFGVLLPFLCFVFDPGIIRFGLGSGTLLSGHEIFIYTLGVLVGLSLIAAWTRRHRLRRFAGVIAGILLAGSVCSFLIGIIMLPLTLFGLFVVIGILGFAPLISGFVYLRNGIPALREANATNTRTTFVAAVVFGVALSLGGPAILETTVSRSIQSVLRSESPSQDTVQMLSHLSWVVSMDPVALAYEREKDPRRKSRLADTYREITGGDVETRLAILRD